MKKRHTIYFFVIIHIILIIISTVYVSGAEKTLKLYDAGERVQELQEELIKQGYLDGTADGLYGPITQKAVEDYQRANGLEVTGNADEATLEGLFPAGTENTVKNKKTKDNKEPIEITTDNVSKVRIGQYIRVTGYGEVYNSSEGKIIINGLNRPYGIRTTVKPENDHTYTIHADSIDPGEFTALFASYPPMVFNGYDLDYKGVYYDNCTVTISGFVKEFGDVEGEVWKYAIYLKDAKLENIELNVIR